MSSCAATRRASSTSAALQHPESDSPPHSFSVTPVTSCPASRKSAAATEESTPPLIATSTRVAAVIAGDANRAVAGALAPGVAVPEGAGHPFEGPGGETAAKRSEASGLVAPPHPRHAQRLGHADGSGHVGGPGAQPPLLSAPLDQRLDRNVAPAHQRADALGPAELVRRHRDEAPAGGRLGAAPP